MSYHLLYNRFSGNLIDISTSEFPPERLDPQLSAETREGNAPDMTRVCWDSATLEFIPRAMREYSKLEFLKKL